ncbi:hypothetical protein H7352_06110 [Vibrio metschnikovii]|nr:hypothetical protein [Vibrio metschnikovii]
MTEPVIHFFIYFWIDRVSRRSHSWMRSLSATILQQLLRQNMGFEGVIISDSTKMGEYY